MKATLIVFLCGLLAIGQAVQVREVVSPVTRVVRLLVSLSEQIEDEGKKEEDLYETFVCWGKSVISQKTESNKKATARIDALETYIADLEAGRITLTSEKEDLEKEIKELTADLDAAKAIREKEKKDYESATDEMKKGIKALDEAIQVLEEATKDNKKEALLAYKAKLNSGLKAVEAESLNLDHAADLGDRFLSKADAVFLRRLLTGDVPERNDAMLRKKADFKKSYKARSGKIQDVLARLHTMFTNNLNEAEAKEKDAQEQYEKLTTAKQDQLDKAEQALEDMAVETGARQMTKEQAQEEVDALKKNVEADEKFIEQTKTSLKEKKGEWEARTEIRNNELTAISKAIEVLHNDDARDLFKKSFASQEGGFFFLQKKSSNMRAALVAQAVSQLNQLARRTGDKRLSAIASLVSDEEPEGGSVKTKFGPIIEAIDKMVETLREEEGTDLTTKEDCEKHRMEITRKALLAGRDIDEKTDVITKLEEEIKELAEQMKQLLEQKKQVKEELEKATRIREDETKLWEKTDKDDKEAAIVVMDATKVLKGFYESVGLLQKSHQPKVVEGEAPPPPPATWEGDYGTKKGEGTGIIALLEMIHEDIEKDQAKAKEEEDQAQKEYDDFKEKSEKQMEDLQAEHDEKEGIKGEKETEKETVVGERRTKHEEWDGLMKTMAETAPNCEYYAVNFKMRAENRAIEIDGLLKAKAILQGGSFK